MKKILISTAVAAIFAATILIIVNNNDSLSTLFEDNVEALADTETTGDEKDAKECKDNGGNWNMASQCVDSGFQTTTCTISGEISFLGITLKGSYTKGKAYTVAWARYTCVYSSGNCCIKQGLYTGETKLA